LKIINLSEYKSYPQTNCSNLFNSFSWLKVLRTTYNLDFKVVTNHDNSFVLPFCIDNNPSLKTIKSIPFGDYILNNCNEVDLNMVLTLLRESYPRHFIKVTIVSNKLTSVNSFNVKKKGFLNQIFIKKWKESRDWKEAYERNIRNALNYGLAVRISNSFDSIVDFYKLHEQLRIEKFKKLPQPFNFFNNIYKEYIVDKKGFLLEAWNKEVLIASWVILINNKTLFYKFGSSKTEHLQLRPNDLLFRSLMQYGSDNNFQNIDLGYSGAAKSYEGLIRFKSKEGGEKIPIYSLKYYPDHFNKDVLIEKTNFLNEMTKKAIGSDDINIIRETSSKYYHQFA
jgi:hypothetical protein